MQTAAGGVGAGEQIGRRQNTSQHGGGGDMVTVQRDIVTPKAELCGRPQSRDQGHPGTVP